MSAFQRSTIAMSCLSACAIERIHIFEEGSSPLVARIAAGENTILEAEARRRMCYMYMNTHLLLPYPLPHRDCQRRTFRTL